MARYAAALLVFMALLGLTGCLFGYGGGHYSSYNSPEYVCYDLVVDYYWTGNRWVPVYQTVCEWVYYDLAPGGEVDAEYRLEGDSVLVKTSGDELATDQIIGITNADGLVSVIRVVTLGETEAKEEGEVLALTIQ